LNACLKEEARKDLDLLTERSVGAESAGDQRCLRMLIWIDK